MRAWAIVHVLVLEERKSAGRKWMLNPIQSMPSIAHSAFVPMVQSALIFETEKKEEEEEEEKDTERGREACGMNGMGGASQPKITYANKKSTIKNYPRWYRTIASCLVLAPLLPFDSTAQFCFR